MLVSGRYTLNNSERVEHREFDVSLPLSDDDESTMVSVMRRALSNLSEEIVAGVERCAPPDDDHDHDHDHDGPR